MAGPYRSVHDSELRDIFYLTPQSGRAFMFTVHTQAFPGAASPTVTAILREMLSLHDMSPPQRVQFKRHIAEALPGREQIVIRAHLVNIVAEYRKDPGLILRYLTPRRCLNFGTSSTRWRPIPILSQALARTRYPARA